MGYREPAKTKKSDMFALQVAHEALLHSKCDTGQQQMMYKGSKVGHSMHRR